MKREWMARRGAVVTVVIAVLTAVACEETETLDRDAGAAPVEERAGPASVEVEPVSLDTVGWFIEGRTVEFESREYLVVGQPVFDPAVEHVGEFEGTPLYAEPGVAGYPVLYIPLENDNWQRLEPTAGPAGTEATGGFTPEPAPAGSPAGGGGGG